MHNQSSQNNLPAPGLFSNSQQTQPSQNLFSGFGNQQQQQQPQPSSIFGASQMGTSTGGLFGQPNQQQGTLIFGSN